jgi:hypothetical protein
LGVCCTNPCEQLSGEISTHLVLQLGLGDERLLHTILVSYHLHIMLQKGKDHQFEGFSGGLSSFYICLQIETSWSHRGRPVNLVKLRSREICLRSESETSPMGFS